jgi:2-iminobutanoate/2-iminopropanoate deaminase
MEKSFVRGTWQKDSAFSPAVSTKGGKIVWLAGHSGEVDDSGNSLAGDFDAQTKQAFRNLEATLRQAGGELKDIVTMTVSLIDARYTMRMTEIRREIFGTDFAASAAITCAGLAYPAMMIEIQAIAVVPD